MKAFTTLASAAAIAVALAAAATPSQASVVLFASFDTGTSNANNITWTQDGSGTGGTLATIGAHGAAVKFTFLGDSNLSGFDNLDANLTLSGTAVNTPADFDGATYTQTGISNGTFNFIYEGATETINGFNIVHNVTSLFSGTFDNAWIQGAGGVGGVDVTVANGGAATFTSSIYPLANATDDAFTLHLGTVTPNFGAANPNTGCSGGAPIVCTTAGTTSLNSFSAHAGGDFQAAIPEPATWGLMLVGFGGMGALLRSRRRMAAVAA